MPRASVAPVTASGSELRIHEVSLSFSRLLMSGWLRRQTQTELRLVAPWDSSNPGMVVQVDVLLGLAETGSSFRTRTDA
jgi:hypothetical protein